MTTERRQYGTGTKFQIKSGKWRTQMFIGGKIRCLGTYDTEEKADAALLSAAKNKIRLPFLGGTSLYVYGEQWLVKCREAKVRDIRNMESRWRSVIADAPFANLPIEVIRRPEVRDWVKTLLQHASKRAVLKEGKWSTEPTGETISWQTAKNALSLLRNVFADALDKDLIGINPTVGLKLPRRQETSEGWTYLNASEIEAVFLLDLSKEQRTVFTVAIYQGLRLGEIAALRWEDVDLGAKSMLVRGSWQTATKTGKVRRIPVLEPAAAALRLWKPDRKRVGPVFPGPGGAIYARGYDWGWGDRRYGEKDIPQLAGIARRVRFHDLRHTCASMLVSGSWGEPWTLVELAKFLGHQSTATTERYAHLMPTALHAKAAETAKKLHQNYTAQVIQMKRK